MDMENPLSENVQEAELIHQLGNPHCYDHPTDSIQHVETHISHILLSGPFAYKIKKPLNLGFLDFSTLGKRQHACQEEVRLNQRLAPATYLGVVPITGSPSDPHINGTGAPFEYAVKMRQFPPDATLDLQAEHGQLTSTHIEAIGTSVARFHLEGCARTDADDPWGAPDQVWHPVAQNFMQISPLLTDLSDRQQLDALQKWSEFEHARLTPLMAARKRDGFVRECHGDLHLGNMAWVNGQLLIFDCLEFNPGLRWLDIQSDIAFCTMDLIQRDHMDWAWLMLNTWLEKTGDYAGLALLRYYMVYRALVRAKIAVLRAGQTNGLTHDAALAETHKLLNLATELTRPWPLRLDITHGFSGSGKTTATQSLMQIPGAIRLRSDIERKRLAGLDALAQSNSGIGQNLYTTDTTRQTYTTLAQLAGGLLDANWPVIVDATFLAHWQRDLLRKQAQSHGVPFHILDFEVPAATLRDRVIQRGRSNVDASEAGIDVLQHQMATEEKLAPHEQADVTRINLPLQG